VVSELNMELDYRLAAGLESSELTGRLAASSGKTFVSKASD
jgi:hypothetical protein